MDATRNGLTQEQSKTFSDIVLELSANLSNPREVLGYTILLRGPHFENYALDGIPSIPGCEARIQMIDRHDAPAPTCKELDTHWTDQLDGHYQAASGHLLESDPSVGRSTITLRIENAGWSNSAGKRILFALPEVGGANGSPDRPVPPDSPAGYAPGSVDLKVNYRTLAPAERIETATPPTVESDMLSWSTTTSFTISAHGSTIDAVGEDHQSQAIFIIGVLAALFPVLLSGCLTLVRRVERYLSSMI
ncbi:hypothetical protein IV500_16970 [Paeniglutamicibacter antarcticus]|uniref:Uncharacterized protein n=1 Tax=Arthrobacter terrae TaxID=2935737 RepID=A0A931CM18_9MICC|nr:hypothetical protein [Arthrobacter terrae]MBG0741067.1 hypothetical protein [Arthrobacter terrae]